MVPELLTQHYSNYEIVIVLDRCEDKSLAFLQNQNADKIRIVEIEESPRGWDHKKYALTKGVEASNQEWLLFTDADCTPFSDRWLEVINNQITTGTKILLGYSPYISNGSILQNFIQFEGFVTAFNYLSQTILGRPYMGVGRNLAIERSFFCNSGGYESFREVVGGDDDLFIQKNANTRNTEIFLGKDSQMVSRPKNTWREYISQKTRHLSVGGAYSYTDQLIHIILGGSLLLVWLLLPFVISENILPIILFYLLIKVIGYRFAHSKMGVGFNYIWLPLVDLMYAIFLPIIALRSKLVKDIRWKN